MTFRPVTFRPATFRPWPICRRSSGQWDGDFQASGASWLASCCLHTTPPQVGAYIFLYKRGFSRVARVVGGSAADFFLFFVSDRNFVILLSFGYFSFGLYLFCKYLCVLVFFFSICVLLCVLY